jgi:leader peptidase (prepilin peptidase)/N-methyltransferase
MTALAPADKAGMMSLQLELTILAGVLGAVLGSGVTALAHRVPRDVSWLTGRSACTSCGRTLAAIDLVPVLSFAFSRGRCRQCGARIAWRYPITELWCAAWAVLLFRQIGPAPTYPFLLLWGCLLVALTWIDLDFKLLPDVLTFTGTLLGLAATLMLPHGAHRALLGLLIGSGALWLVGWLYKRVRGVEGMGFGDVKLAAMFGVVLGGPLTFLTMMLAALAGSIWGAALILRGRGSGRTELPFGTLLAPAAMITFLVGERLVNFYLTLMHRG